MSNKKISTLLTGKPDKAAQALNGEDASNIELRAALSNALLRIGRLELQIELLTMRKERA